MMKYEFEALAGYEVSLEDYNKIIEPMYMATALTKEEFVKTINKKRFALKPLKSLVKEMKQVAKEIEIGCTHATTYIEWETLYKLVEEYVGRKYGDFATYITHENEKQTCYYPASIEIYGRKGYKTIEIINLI